MADTKKKNSKGSGSKTKELTASVRRPSRTSSGSGSDRSRSVKKSSSTGTRKASSVRSGSRSSSGVSAAGERQRRVEEAPASEPREKLSPDRVDEIVGIVFIALGIVAGILTYGGRTSAALGSLVSFMFGLVGVVQYAMPILLVVIGVVLIAVPRRQAGTGSIALCLGVVWCVNCIIHLASVNVGPRSFGEYVHDGFVLGKDGLGGGLLSAIPAYLLEKLITTAGAIVVFCAVALVFILLVTKLSLRSAGKKVIAKVDAMEDNRKARLIDEKVGEDRIPGIRRKPAKAAAAEPVPTPAKSRDLLIGEGESDTLSGSFDGKRRRRSKMKIEESDINTVISEAATANDGEPTLDFLPTSGTLPRDAANYGDISYTPIPHDNDPIIPGAEEPIPTVDEYDPFETIEIIPEDNITGEIPDEGRDSAAGDPEGDAAADPAANSSADPADPNAELQEPPAVRIYQRPPLSLLKKPDRSEQIANDSPEEKGKLLIDTLASFNINARVTAIAVGPVITRYEVQPAQGVRVNRITSLSNDIALALAAPRVRIEAPIPGKAAIGIEIPNKATAMVRLREVLDTRDFSSSSSPLTFALGKDIAGKPVIADLERMPHMLIAGATGSGKSVCINSIILSTLYKSSPDEVRMILIDPKVVELSIFAPVPHLYCPVVTDAKKAAGVLKWACLEMEKRYNRMGEINARDLARFNSLQSDPNDRMPRLMIIIDELADLMMVSAKEVEESIARIAQLGRAAGIHLVVATQRPSVDVITGLIKTNIPSRIAFAVSSAIDSRVILDTGGAEKLIGHGDMLFHPNGAAKPTRAQGAYVSDEEVEKVMQFFTETGFVTAKDESVLNSIPDLTGSTGQGNGKQEDELLPDAVRIVMDSGSASISMIQRRLRVGYARAARLVDIMEQMKLVSGFDGSKPRKVLIDEAGYAELFGGGAS